MNDTIPRTNEILRGFCAKAQFRGFVESTNKTQFASTYSMVDLT